MELDDMGEKEGIQSTTSGRMTVGNAVYELFIFALTIYSLLLLVVYWLLPISQATKQALFRSDILLSVIFLADSFRSLFRAPDKWAYLKWGWLDFVGSVPGVVQLRLARLARFIRAWRVIRTRHPRQVLQDFERQRAEGVLLVTVFVSVMLISVTSILVLELEGNAPGANIQSGPDAFWWAFSTLTTVAYGDRYPVTNLGRIVAMVLMTVGIGLFGVLASYLAAAFVGAQRTGQEDIALLRDDFAQVKGDLASIEVELSAIKALLSERDVPRQEQAGTGGD
jgi:voltage-gated potassium channel